MSRFKKRSRCTNALRVICGRVYARKHFSRRNSPQLPIRLCGRFARPNEARLAPWTDAPACIDGVPVVFSASRHEPVRLTCRVAAAPGGVTFRWLFSSSNRKVELTEFVVLARGSEGGAEDDDEAMPTATSVLEYTPQFQSDFGTLLCAAENAMGVQKDPCTFHIVQAGEWRASLFTAPLFGFHYKGGRKCRDICCLQKCR